MEIGEAGRRHRERANDANAGRTSPFFCFGFTFRLILAADSATVAVAQRGGVCSPTSVESILEGFPR